MPVPMPSTARLPVSVVIPTRNAMDKLPRHLAHHAEVFDRCTEVIHCDSHSRDGTKDCVAKALASHPGLRQLDHPPGLYESWNHAIAACTQPYIYISTVGDDIDLPGLQRLLELATAHEADVVASPPRYVHESGSPAPEMRWPIDHLIERQGVRAAGVLSPATLYTEAIIHAPDGILGSAASCLFRAAFLQPRPFPLGFHGACDSVWALRYLPSARCVVLPTPVATFLLHPKTYESHGQLNARIAVLVREDLQKVLPALDAAEDRGGMDAPLLQALIAFNATCTELARAHERLVRIRRRWRALWALHPGAWQARARRNALRREARKQESSLIARPAPPEQARARDPVVA